MIVTLVFKKNAIFLLKIADNRRDHDICRPLARRVLYNLIRIVIVCARVK
jgi:hypothetical protein